MTCRVSERIFILPIFGNYMVIHSYPFSLGHNAFLAIIFRIAMVVNKAELYMFIVHEQ